MKTLAIITATFLTLLLSASFASAQTSTEIETIRAERTVAIFNLQNKHEVAKEKNMGEAYSLNVEKADLTKKRNEVQVVNDENFPKYVEMNNAQQGAWEYAQAKQAWVDANPAQYAALLNETSTN